MAAASFDVMAANAVDLQDLLSRGTTTSVDIVLQYLAQIDRYEKSLNAFISLAPREKVIRAAEGLDTERQHGKIRSALHGIPVVLKDSFTTASHLGMSTTAGSLAFVGSKATKNSTIVQLLTDAGLIILGKTNMTEFAGMKMTMMMPGWSSHGGQTISPYVGQIEENETLLGHSAPGGSSTGSAVAVAAGFSPLAMGAETIGSIVTPSTRAALYALKPTVGVQDTTGVYSLTDFFDSPGPMAKSAADVRAMAEILLRRSFDSPDWGTWKDLRVGFLDPKVWNIAEGMCEPREGAAEQMVEDYEATIERLRQNACSLNYPVDIAEVSALTVDEKQAIMPIAFWEFRHVCIPRFIKAFDECPVQNVEDIVDFNEKNKEKAMPNPYTEQNDLKKTPDSDEKPEHIETLKTGLRDVGKRILDEVFDREQINIIAAPGDSALCVHAAAAGYPIATVPVGQLRYNGRPFGLCLVGRGGDEQSLLRFMAAYEAVSAPRPVPDLTKIV